MNIKKKYKLPDQLALSYEEIDEFIEKLTSLMEHCRIRKSEASKNRLFIEEMFLRYREKFGEDTLVKVSCRRGPSGLRIDFGVKGESFHPLTGNGRDGEIALLRSLAKNFDNAPVWKYKNGINRVSFLLYKEKRISSTVFLLLTVAGSVALGLAGRSLGGRTAVFIGDEVLAPVYTALMGLLTTTAIAFVFLSIINGICCIGDISTFNQLGKKLIAKFMLMLVLVDLACCILFTPMFHITFESKLSFDFTDIYQMVINIIPTNLISPFIDGNTLQIVFLAICFGIIILYLGKSVDTVKECLAQFEMIMFEFANQVTKTIPLIVFISIYRTIVSGDLDSLISVAKLPVLLTAGCLVTFAIGYILSALQGLDLRRFTKGYLPLLLMTFTTASSSAALPLTFSIAEEQFGMDHKVSRAGIPLGQTLFKPACVVMPFVSILCLSEVYNVEMTFTGVITLAFMSLVLSFAAPPINNGIVVIMLILFSNFGIPQEAIAIIVALDVLSDRIETATNVVTLQMVLCQLSSNLKRNQHE